MRPNLVTGLDIGSTKTCAVIAEIAAGEGRASTVKILGVGQARTGGMRRDVVTDIEGTMNSVRAAVKEAELMGGVGIDRVWVGTAGEHVHATTSTGVVAVGSDREIRENDVRRVHEVARAVAIPADRELLHVIPQQYIVDNQGGIRDAIGMAGTRLEAEVYIVTSSVTVNQNLAKAVTRAGYKIDGLVYAPLATALAVLSDDEKDVGVGLVDIGGANTDIAVFRDGELRRLSSIPWGGSVVTNDLAKGLSITFAEAERAKESYGVAFAQLVDPRQTVELPGPGPGSKREVTRELIAHIIEQRVDEILELVLREMEHAGELNRLGAGVVLTGGGAALPGVSDVAQHVFGLPVRVGTPGHGLAGLADSVRRPQFATAAGLVIYAVEHGGVRGTSGFGESAIARAMAWLKEFF